MLVGSQVAKQTVQRLDSEASRKRRAGQGRFGAAGEEDRRPENQTQKMKNDELKGQSMYSNRKKQPLDLDEKMKIWPGVGVTKRRNGSKGKTRWGRRVFDVLGVVPLAGDR